MIGSHGVVSTYKLDHQQIVGVIDLMQMTSSVTLKPRLTVLPDVGIKGTATSVYGLDGFCYLNGQIILAQKVV